MPKPEYEDIYMPKNSGTGLIIAAFAFIGRLRDGLAYLVASCAGPAWYHACR